MDVDKEFTVPTKSSIAVALDRQADKKNDELELNVLSPKSGGNNKDGGDGLPQNNLGIFRSDSNDSDIGLTASMRLKKQVNFVAGPKSTEVRIYNPSADNVHDSSGNRCFLIRWCADLVNMLRDRREDRQDDFDALDFSDLTHGRTVYEGNLWKLNTGVGAEEALRDVRQWRRRQFFLQKTQNKLTMLYTSEKENGAFQHACNLASKIETSTDLQKVGKVQSWKVVSVEALDDKSRNKVLNDLATYDTAFGVRKEPHEYEREIPTQMHPFIVDWIDDDNEKKQLVLAGSSARITERWIQAIERSIKQLQRDLQRGRR
jgi:hypothetical protein